MSVTSAMTCIGEPISWLKLETFAITPDARRDAAVRDHVAACPACKQCLAEIERDVVALPPLAVVAKKRPWWHFAMPALGLAVAAAAILLLVIRPHGAAPRPSNQVAIKGVGVVVIDVVRERAGTIRQDVRTFQEGDRFKLVITCPPDHTAHVEVSVRDEGTHQLDRPLGPADLVCGNRVVLPGAFSVTGHSANEVCVDVTGPVETKTACLTLLPE
jgi:hypothetical protein